MSHRSRIKRDNCFFCERKFSYDRFSGFQSNGLIIKTRDHIVPTSKGGREDDTNCVVCCADCNTFKGPSTISEFIERLQSVISTGGTIKNIPDILIVKMLKKAEQIKKYIESKGEKMYVCTTNENHLIYSNIPVEGAYLPPPPNIIYSGK